MLKLIFKAILIHSNIQSNREVNILNNTQTIIFKEMFLKNKDDGNV